MKPEDIKRAAESFTEVSAIRAAKRCGVRWKPWMGDWFTSWSPRNDYSGAEGTWDHWVELAVKVLRDPMTAIVHPQAHELGQRVEPRNFYDESNRTLTDEELAARFAGESDAVTPEAGLITVSRDDLVTVLATVDAFIVTEPAFGRLSAAVGVE